MPFIRIQELSVDAIGRCFRDIIEVRYKGTKYKFKLP